VLSPATGHELRVILPKAGSEKKSFIFQSDFCKIIDLVRRKFWFRGLTEMKTTSSDTTIDAAVKQFEILRKLDTETRAQMTFQLSDNLHQIVEDGIRHRHPEFNEKQVKRELLRLTIGEQLTSRIFAANKS